ncbi:MAG: alanine--tRNA ligase, partial [Chloroflexi bacterium]|nr:alanine--tRNA ligase [Chloroflexota bacterium]
MKAGRYHHTMTMTGHQIREAFLKYFESQNHLRVASASLIPVGDPTLLLTNAGMVQFKPYFTGETKPPNKRLTSSQKSFRTVDIDEVGDATHLTLFEMLGNFSIGDYFKEGAIKFALECLAGAMGLPKEKFAITIHTSDDDAGELWQKAGIPKKRIFKFGDDHNWWGPAGLEGPCGPCSELHYDFGDDKGCGKDNCGPNCENPMSDGETCNRYVELWNLVFMQFYHQLDGKRPPLPAPSVDTGMGLERLAVVLQGAKSIYDTDLFTPLLDAVARTSGKAYGKDADTSYAMRVVAEHGRSASFLIADGVVPGNDGRGYVLRRLIRRAIRHGRKLGLTENFMGEIADAVIKHMGDSYPELQQQENFIKTVLKLEEDRFQQVFQIGFAFLTEAMEKGKTLKGETVFKLWDTYGFPVEMTQEIARERNIEVDIKGFEKEMGHQRERARASAKFGGDRSKIKLYESLGAGGVEFLGYRQLGVNTVVVGLITGDQVVGEVTEGQEIEIVLRETPFYPEGGGQIGDAGQISSSEGLVQVRDSQTVMKGLIVQFGKVKKGKIALGETVEAIVDPVHREDTARNHTATHMVHAALRQVLGTHVRQAGSLVTPTRLRFDFTHMKPVEQDELKLVQHLVNEKLRQNARVIHSEDNYTTAI